MLIDGPHVGVAVPRSPPASQFFLNVEWADSEQVHYLDRVDHIEMP